MVLKHKDQLL